MATDDEFVEVVGYTVKNALIGGGARSGDKRHGQEQYAQ